MNFRIRKQLLDLLRRHRRPPKLCIRSCSPQHHMSGQTILGTTGMLSPSMRWLEPYLAFSTSHKQSASILIRGCGASLDFGSALVYLMASGLSLTASLMKRVRQAWSKLRIRENPLSTSLHLDHNLASIFISAVPAYIHSRYTADNRADSGFLCFHNSCLLTRLEPWLSFLSMRHSFRLPYVDGASATSTCWTRFTAI